MDLSEARAIIKTRRRAVEYSMEELSSPKHKKSRTAWLKNAIGMMNKIYGKFNLMHVQKKYKSTSDRTNYRIYLSINDKNFARLVNVIITTKKMMVELSDLPGYISAHALERMFCCHHLSRGPDFLDAYFTLVNAVIKPSWTFGEGLNVYTESGVMCAIKDTNDNGDIIFIVKTYIQSESFTLGNEHDRHYQKVLDTGEIQKDFVRRPD